jgi:hypothetical protein
MRRWEMVLLPRSGPPVMTASLGTRARVVHPAYVML